MDDGTLDLFEWKRNSEDYTGSCCLLLALTDKWPRQEEVLIDAEDLPLVAHLKWRLLHPRNKPPTSVTSRIPFGGSRITLYLHRYLLNAPPGMFIDHRNLRPMDNRRQNLRECTHAQNMANKRVVPRLGSPFKGVHHLRHKTRRPWAAVIKHRQQTIHLGVYFTPEEAAEAYNDAALRLFGEFARLNDI